MFRTESRNDRVLSELDKTVKKPPKITKNHEKRDILGVFWEMLYKRPIDEMDFRPKSGQKGVKKGSNWPKMAKTGPKMGPLKWPVFGQEVATLNTEYQWAKFSTFQVIYRTEKKLKNPKMRKKRCFYQKSRKKPVISSESEIYYGNVQLIKWVFVGSCPKSGQKGVKKGSKRGQKGWFWSPKKSLCFRLKKSE